MTAMGAVMPEVGDHFAVVAEPQGDGGVGQAEHHGEDLAKDLALGDEDEGGHADEGGGPESMGMAAAEEEDSVTTARENSHRPHSKPVNLRKGFHACIRETSIKNKHPWRTSSKT